MDPRTKLGLLACVGLLAVTLESPVALGVLALTAGLPLLTLRLPPRWWLRGLGGLLLVVWSTVLSQGIFYSDLPRVALVELGPVTIWREGVLWGLAQSLRFVATLLAGSAVAASTPPASLYAALLELRVPYALAFLSTTALRAVPQTARAAWQVRQARARRGRPSWQRSPWAWLKLEVAMLRPVVAESLRRARALAESLDARGFDPSHPRASRTPLRFAAWEPPLLAAAALLTLGLMTLRVLFLLYTAEALYVPGWRPLYGAIRAWM